MLAEMAASKHPGLLRRDADALLRQGAFAAAHAKYDELRAELTAEFGPQHTYVAAVVETLGGVARQLGDRAAARAYFQAARAIYTAADPLRVSGIDHVLAYLDPLPDAVLAKRPRLAVTHVEGGREHPVVQDEVLVGRGIERVEILVLSNAVSKMHARLRWRDGVGWQIDDLSSENGILFEGERISARTISNGDVYRLGDQHLACTLA